MLKAAAFQGNDSAWQLSGEAAVSMRTEGASFLLMLLLF